MPLYDFECTACGAVSEHLAAINEKTMTCECGSTMRRLITTNYSVAGDLESYVESNLGHEPIRIKGRKHLEAEMKKRGLYVRHKGWW